LVKDPVRYDKQPELEDDMKTSRGNLKSAEKDLGAWKYKPKDFDGRTSWAV